jgi:hypothetical protein
VARRCGSRRQPATRRTTNPYTAPDIAHDFRRYPSAVVVADFLTAGVPVSLVFVTINHGGTSLVVLSNAASSGRYFPSRRSTTTTANNIYRNSPWRSGKYRSLQSGQLQAIWCMTLWHADMHYLRYWPLPYPQTCKPMVS